MKNLKLKTKTEQSSQSYSLLPSYYYPNKAVPLNKISYDTIDVIKNQKLFGRTPPVNEAYRNLSAEMSMTGVDNNHTLLDQHRRKDYLGNTNLLHNPIINPIDDVNRNRYLDGQKYKHVYQNPNGILSSVGYNIVG